MFDELGMPPTQKPKRFVEFDLHPVRNAEKSAAEGRPIYDEAEYIKITVPGDKNNIVHRPVRPSDKQEFSAEYRRFKAGEEMQQSGTPLKSWPGISRAEVEELAFFNVRTVEQLAEMSDGNARNLGPVMAMRQRARDFIAAAKGNAPLEQVRAENEALKNRLEAMERQMSQLAEAKQSDKVTEKRKGA